MVKDIIAENLMLMIKFLSDNSEELKKISFIAAAVVLAIVIISTAVKKIPEIIKNMILCISASGFMIVYTLSFLSSFEAHVFSYLKLGFCMIFIFWGLATGICSLISFIKNKFRSVTEGNGNRAENQECGKKARFRDSRIKKVGNALVIAAFVVIFPIGELYTPTRATYVDFSTGYDFIMDSTHYYEKTFNDGWYTGIPQGDKFLVKGEGKKGRDTALFIDENNDGRFGIMILGELYDEKYVFPSDIPYPDFSAEPPDTIRIYSSNEYVVVLESEKDLKQIKKIAQSVYEKNVYELLPEEMKNDEGISQINITLSWDDYPYYFTQTLIKTDSGEYVPEISVP